MHDGARAEPVLVAYGITTTGDPVFLHLAAVSAESTRGSAAAGHRPATPASGSCAT